MSRSRLLNPKSLNAMRAHLSALAAMTEGMLDARQGEMWQASDQDKQELQNLLLNIDAEKEGQ